MDDKGLKGEWRTALAVALIGVGPFLLAIKAFEAVTLAACQLIHPEMF